MAALRFFNYLSRKKQVFKPIKKGSVGLYTCGPTVYNYAHIGNLRTYIFEDVLRRTLEYAGYKVRHVMNITDVGHLTSDADTGEDKLEKEARAEKKSVWDVAKFYTKAFLNDIERLNIKKARVLTPATAHIKDQIAVIRQLFKKGLAYETASAVYFDVSKFKNYAKLSRQKLNQKITGAREEVVIDPEKRHPYDFVLWFKLAGRFKNHIMRWPSPWGEGFPGWHIECSAISTKYLGQPLDIHTGGVDHVNIHHTNEIAQSEGAYGKPLAKYWMEGEFLLIDRGKMAKSEGNFITLETLIKKGFNPLSFRYLALSAHYRSQLNFTWEAMRGAENSLGRLREFVRTFKQSHLGTKFPSGNLVPKKKKFHSAISDDLNTPKALAVAWNLINEYHKSASRRTQKYDAKAILDLLYDFDKVLGLGLADVKPEIAPPEAQKLLKEREKARKAKDFKKADEIREKIRRLGWQVNDTERGSHLFHR